MRSGNHIGLMIVFSVEVALFRSRSDRKETPSYGSQGKVPQHTHGVRVHDEYVVDAYVGIVEVQGREVQADGKRLTRRVRISHRHGCVECGIFE